MNVLLVFSCLLVLAAGKAVDPNIELPPTLKICKRNDPKRDDCIKDSMQTFLPSLHKKIENIDLPSIDPFMYDSVTFEYKNSNTVNGRFTVKDVKTYGMSRGKVLKVKSNFKNDEMNLQAEIIFPKIFSTGHYSSNMTVSTFQLNSKGQYNVTMKNLKAKWNIKGKLQKVDGEDFMKIYKFDILPEAEDMKISVSGLFADENLNKVVNEFFNQNWKMFYKEMIPETKKQWEPILLDFVEKFFSQFPFRRLLLNE